MKLNYLLTSKNFKIYNFQQITSSFTVAYAYRT